MLKSSAGYNLESELTARVSKVIDSIAPDAVPVVPKPFELPALYQYTVVAVLKTLPNVRKFNRGEFDALLLKLGLNVEVHGEEQIYKKEVGFRSK